MSMASPTLRSSSSTVPGPSFNRSPTSMRARPSTADTCTGTSNTVSRSEAIREVGSSFAASVAAAAAASIGPGWSRSGSGTLLLLSLMAQAFPDVLRLRIGRGACLQVAPDRLTDFRLDRLAIALDPAVGPFDMAIARLDLRVGKDDQAS